MPKPKADESIRNAFTVLEMVVQKAINNARMEGHNEALASIRSLVGGGTSADVPFPFKRGPGRPKGSKNKVMGGTGVSSGKKRKNSWTGLSAEARLARVNAIRQGKGLPPRDK